MTSNALPADVVSLKYIGSALAGWPESSANEFTMLVPVAFVHWRPPRGVTSVAETVTGKSLVIVDPVARVVTVIVIL